MSAVTHEDQSAQVPGRARPPVIDAHVHVWDVTEQPWTAEFPELRRSFDLAEFSALAAENGIDGAVVVQAGDSASETRELLDQAADCSLVAGVVGWAGLDRDDLEDQLARLSEAPGAAKLVGLRHQLQLEPDPQWITGAAVRRGLARLGSVGLVYDIVVSPGQLADVLDTVRLTPGTRFVLDHAGKPPLASGELDRWRADLSALAGCSNLAVKLSGLITEADLPDWRQSQLDPVIAHVLEVFGPERTMIGSDWPVCLLAADYSQVRATTQPVLAGLAPHERASVLGATAIDWYGISWPC